MRSKVRGASFRDQLSKFIQFQQPTLDRCVGDNLRARRSSEFFETLSQC